MTHYQHESDGELSENSGASAAAIVVGSLIIVCACALIIAATMALIKWMLGL